MADMEFQCPNCHKFIISDERIVGRRAPCPHCQTPLFFNDKFSAILEVGPAQPHPVHQNHVAMHPPHHQTRHMAGVALLSAGLIILGVVIAVASIRYLPRNGAASPAPTPPPPAAAAFPPPKGKWKAEADLTGRFGDGRIGATYDSFVGKYGRPVASIPIFEGQWTRALFEAQTETITHVLADFSATNKVCHYIVYGTWKDVDLDALVQPIVGLYATNWTYDVWTHTEYVVFKRFDPLKAASEMLVNRGMTAFDGALLMSDVHDNLVFDIYASLANIRYSNPRNVIPKSTVRLQTWAYQRVVEAMKRERVRQEEEARSKEASESIRSAL